MSLSDYLRAEIEEIAAIPTPEEMEERLRKLPRIELTEPPSREIRRMRDAAG